VCHDGVLYSPGLCGIGKCSIEQALPRVQGCGMAGSGHRRDGVRSLCWPRYSWRAYSTQWMSQLAYNGLSSVRRPGRMRLGHADHDRRAARRGAFTQLRQMPPSGTGERHAAKLAARHRTTPQIIDGRTAKAARCASPRLSDCEACALAGKVATLRTNLAQLRTSRSH